jgi:hypothetical protein
VGRQVAEHGDVGGIGIRIRVDGVENPQSEMYGRQRCIHQPNLCTEGFENASGKCPESERPRREKIALDLMGCRT